MTTPITSRGNAPLAKTDSSKSTLPTLATIASGSTIAATVPLSTTMPPTAYRTDSTNAVLASRPTVPALFRSPGPTLIRASCNPSVWP